MSHEHLKGAHSQYLLWGLLFLESCCILPILTRIMGGVNEKAFCYWSHIFVEETSNLKPRVIVWSKLSLGPNLCSNTTCSVNGVDCQTQE